MGCLLSTPEAELGPPPGAHGTTPAAGGGSRSTGRVGTGCVLGKPLEDVRGSFVLGPEIGRGQFGITYLCTEKETGKQYACKSIAKRKLVSKEDIEDVTREVAIMHHLTGHKNIVEVKGSYEDKHSVHIVMELCTGGELFDRITQRGHYSERQAASLLRTIVSVVEFCHAHNVMHRDLKPENFLLASKAEDAQLKTTDFGLSVFFKPGDTFADIVGSAYYVAPEVLRRRYSKEADVWSCGVILYILLCGVPPFWADSEQGIFDAVLQGKVDFQRDPWPQISPGAKDLIKKMLNQDPKRRLTAHQVLVHPWVREDGEAPDTALAPAVLTKLKQFSVHNKLKKMALKVIASKLSEEEIAGLKEMFKAMDADNSGSITFEELREGLRNHGSTMPEEQIRQLMQSADADGSGTIDYTEFITATMHTSKLENEETLHEAFKHFDKDGSGSITVDELRESLSKEGTLLEEDIRAILEEVDTDKDGTIDLQEFVAMMRKGNPTFKEDLAKSRKGRA